MFGRKAWFLLTHSLLVQGLAMLECSCLLLNDVNVVLLIHLFPQQGLARAQKLLICMSLKDAVVVC